MPAPTANDLSVQQRMAVRTIKENMEARRTWSENVDGRTLRALARKGVVALAPDGSMLGIQNPVFNNLHRQIMSSGDGPEYLKAMLRFPGGR